MKRLSVVAMVVVAAMWVAGCAPSVRRPEAMAGTGTTGVFTEVAAPAGAATNGAPEGMVDLSVRFSLKAPLPGAHLIEPKGSLVGKPGYPFILTIDGQSVLWREDGVVENTPTYDEKGLRTVEGGQGRRYVFERRIRLAAGTHRVEIDLPEECVACAFDVTLKEKSGRTVLELEPIYKAIGKQRPTYLHGVSRLAPTLDSVPLPPKEREEKR